MISGPHAIGKTTTAKAIAEKTDSLLVGSIAGFVAQRLKYKIDNNPANIDTAKYQQEVLNGFELVCEATYGNNRVFDRSPLDFTVYLALALRGDLSLHNSIMHHYSRRCIELTNRHCDVLILPQADLNETYESKPGRPAFTEKQKQFRKDYSEMLNLYRLSIDSRVKVFNVPVDKQYEKRVKYIMKGLDK